MSKKIEISEETYNTLKEQILAEENKVKEKSETKIEIRNRWTGNIIYSSSKTTFKDAVVEAVESGANLSGADLHGADLHEANLSEANLSGANLSGANLHGADLHEANLRGADLREANLSEANLREANLRGADLRGADLRGANLSEANLRGVELQNVKFYGRGGNQKIKKSQLEDFMTALGFIIEE